MRVRPAESERRHPGVAPIKSRTIPGEHKRALSKGLRQQRVQPLAVDIRRRPPVVQA